MYFYVKELIDNFDFNIQEGTAQTRSFWE